MRQISLSWLNSFDLFDGLFKIKMRSMRSNSQAVDDQVGKIFQQLECRFRNMRTIGDICKCSDPKTKHGKFSMKHRQGNDRDTLNFKTSIWFECYEFQFGW